MKNKLIALAGVALVSSCGNVEDSNRVRAKALGATYVEGNPTCADLGLGDFDFKVESGEGDGLKLIDAHGNEVTLTWDIEAGTMDWTSNIGIDAVLMKGGPNAMVYEYDPESFGDTGLETPFNDGSGGLYGISHVNFCYDYELTVSKTADTSFTRTWDWDITKSVDPDLHQISSGETGTSTYDVTAVNLGSTDSDFAASGTITVSNNTPLLANLKSVSDTLSNGTSVAVECDSQLPTTMGPGDVVTCTYEIGLDDGTNLVNTATADVLENSPVNGNTATADVDFGSATITGVNEAVNIEDNFEGEITALGEVGDTTTFTYSRDFTCDDEGISTNTASIIETGDQATANVRVICADEGDAGCTPGFWKNNTGNWAKTGYSPDDTVQGVFAEAAPYVKARDTLLDALGYKGGGKLSDAAEILLRAAVAGLLDASHPDVSYPMSTAALIDRVNAALATGDRDEILRVKDIIDQYNNLGCPLDADESRNNR